MAEIHSRRVDEKRIDTILDRDVRFEGEIYFKKDLLIKGIFKGTLESEGDVFLAEEAEVEADIKAQSVVIRGSLEGNVKAGSRIELLETARVKGDITAPKIVMDTGCQFDGISRMTAEEKS